MLGKLKPQNQKDMFKPLISEFIDPQHELVVLAGQVNWKALEEGLAGNYSNTGTPSKPVRLMAGLLILKQVYNLGDETIMAAWIRDPYMQYFCGESYFQWQQPCDPSDLVHFRKRIGEQGARLIFQLSLGGHKNDIRKAEAVIIDTTVQEKNITFPTDSKLYVKVIEKCRQLADENGIELRQSYVRIQKQLLLKMRFSGHPKAKKKTAKSLRKLKTIAGRLVRELNRKLPEPVRILHQEQLDRFAGILMQQRQDRDKIYSVHEPDVWCIAKGKSHKPYEFGTKTSIGILPGSNIVVGVSCFKGNPYDGDTLQPALDQIRELSGKTYSAVIVDRGYRGRQDGIDAEIIVPGKRNPRNRKEKQRIRKYCRSRAAIEPIIGHLKTDHRMGRNYLKGFQGDQLNALLAGAAMNFKAWLRKIRQSGSFLLDFFRLQIVGKFFFIELAPVKMSC